MGAESGRWARRLSAVSLSVLGLPISASGGLCRGMTRSPINQRELPTPAHRENSPWCTLKSTKTRKRKRKRQLFLRHPVPNQTTKHGHKPGLRSRHYHRLLALPCRLRSAGRLRAPMAAENLGAIFATTTVPRLDRDASVTTAAPISVVGSGPVSGPTPPSASFHDHGFGHGHSASLSSDPSLEPTIRALLDQQAEIETKLAALLPRNYGPNLSLELDMLRHKLRVLRAFADDNRKHYDLALLVCIVFSTFSCFWCFFFSISLSPFPWSCVLPRCWC